MASQKTSRRARKPPSPAPTVAEHILSAIELLGSEATLAAITGELEPGSANSISPTLARLIKSGHVRRDERKTPPRYTRTRKKYEPIGAGRSTASALGYVDVFEGVTPQSLRSFARSLDEREKVIYHKRLRAIGAPPSLASLAEELKISRTTLNKIQNSLLERIEAMKTAPTKKTP